MTDYIDTRDLQEELDRNLAQQSDILDDLAAARAWDEREPDHEEALQEDLAELEERAEEIIALKDEIGAEAFRFGVTLIAEDDFEDYAREFAEDIGAVDSESQWPVYCIDWERAARELRHDFSSFDFDGESYLGRVG